MKLTPKISRAINLAAVLHDGQSRKVVPVPYITHPFSVAFLLTAYTDDEDIFVAAFMHDCLEDVPMYTREELKKDFGEKIMKIVDEVSDPQELLDLRDKKKTWLERKTRYLERLKKISNKAMMVSCADKIVNLQAILLEYEEQKEFIWAKFNAPEPKKENILWFYENVYKTLKKRLENEIVKKLGQVYRKAKKIIK